MFKLHPLFISLVTAYGLMTPATSAWSAVLKPFTPELNDNRVGVFCVCNGSTQILSGNQQFAPGQNGLQAITIGELLSTGRLISDDNLIGADRLSLGGQNGTVTLPDVNGTGSNTVQVYNASQMSALPPVDAGTALPNYLNVNDGQYIDARVAQVSNGTINVEIGQAGAATTAATNGWTMAAKQSQLFTASGSGNMNWNADNRITFTGAYTPYVYQLGYSVDDAVTYKGAFSVTTLDNSTTQFAVSSLSDLQNYNDWLVDQLRAGNLSASSYNAEFNKAFSFSSGVIAYVIDSDDLNDEIAQPVGDRVVLSADGPGAKVKINAGKTLEVVNASNGAVRATNGATAIIDGKLAITGDISEYSSALELAGGSKGINNGVINGGFFNQADGTGVDSSTLGEGGKTVFAHDNSQFVNNGVINYAISPSTLFGAALWLTDSNGINKGTINLGVTNAYDGSLASGVMLNSDGASFENAKGGTIYLGRTPQNGLNEATTDVAIDRSGETSAIFQFFDSSVINNGHIVIGSGVQNATGMQVEGGPDATTLNNGTIDVNGRAQFQPAENTAMLVIDSGTGGKVGNAGTINLNGDNSTGLKVIAWEEGIASAWSSGTINVTGNADDANGTRNTAVWVSGQDGGHASATLTGPINLSGEAAIGIRAEGNASVNVDRNAVPRSGGGQYQINFLAIGPDAEIALPKDGDYSVSSWHSTVFRYQEGADFDGAGLTIVPDASFSTGIMGSGTGTDINTNGAVLNVGLYSTGLVVEGGAQGVIDSATSLNLTSLNSTAALVDGLKHDLTGYITNISAPDATTSLTNHAAISGIADRQRGLIAQNQAQLTNTGDITLAGDSTTGIMASYGAKVINSGDISVSRSGTGITLFDGSFADIEAPSTVVTNNGNIDVGASSEAVLPTQGISLSGLRGEFYQNGTVSLHGDNVVAGNVYDSAVLYLGETSTVKFNDPGQTGYVGSENAVIASYGGNVDVSTAGSTLYNLSGGTLFNPLAAADITLNGANSVGTLASGVGTTLFGTDRYLVTGDGATAVRVEEGARASVTNPVVLSGANSTGVVSSAGGATVVGLAPVTGSGVRATGYDVGNGASLDNQSQVALSGDGSTGVRLHFGGNFINRAPVTVASGTGVDVSSGYGSYTPLNSELRASDGTAAMRVGEGAVLNVVGDGLYRSTIVGAGSADGILLDRGASSFTASDIIIGSYGNGSAINNRAETENISLNNVFIDASGSGNGIRSATSFDYGGNAYVNVTGEATGYAFGNEDGSATSNDLVIGPNYTFFVTGTGSAIRANTTGRVISDGFITIYSENGGSAIVTSTASEVINRGSIFSFSTTSPIIDLRGGQTVFINEGDLTAPFPETVVVAGGATNDTIALLDGNVVGDVNTGNGTDSVVISGGQINGSLTMGSGVNNQALVKSVDLKNVSHLTTAGGEGSTLSLSDIIAQGGSFSSGDNLAKGVNLGSGWSTLNLIKTRWTLTDNLKLAHSTLNIDPDSTLYVGNQVDPVLEGGSNDSLVVNNAGTLDLTNGNGVAGNTLTVNGDLASVGGSVRLNTLLGGTLNSQQSDTLRVNGNVTGTTLIEDAVTAGSAAVQADTNSNGLIGANEGITLAQVSGSASANSFALKGGYVAAGPWQYGLYSFAPGTADAGQRLVSGSGDQFWDYRLANNYICEDGSLCQPQTGSSRSAVARPAVVPQLPSYLSTPVGLAYSTLAMLDDLHKRLGELRHSENDPQGMGGEMFLRYTGSNLKYMTNVDPGKYGYDFDLDYSAVQVGTNLLKFEGDGESLRGGIAYTRGNTRIRPHAADGYSSTSFDSDSVALYTTWQRDSGFYLDGTLSFDWHRGDTDIARQKEVATLKGKGWNASLETGYPFELGSGIRLEPQAQLTWLQLKMDNFTDRDRTTVNYDNYDQTLARVGARLDRTWQDEAERQYTPYLRTNYTRGWGGTAKATVGAADTALSQSFNSGKFGQIWDVGLGGTTTFKNDVSLYAEADYSKEIDGNGAKGWGYNAGVRWTF